ncbi:MAG: hydroxymethylglutaryl-CoA lyase [Cryomorphaceae bacterium]|nr:hydroxymethylglutaryl-CoA lyase [Cryomorphaceae bacterium]
MQGIANFIPTDLKVAYINRLLQCGFDTLDMGSFVSPKIIPQLKDTSLVLDKINPTTATKLLAIVANVQGAKEAVEYDSVRYLGVPFSISETFQKRNINKSIDASLMLLHRLYTIAANRNKEVVLYLSMGFGNPYGDEWNEELVESWVDKLNINFSPSIIAISDTIGCAKPEQVERVFTNLNASFNEIEFGAHLHVLPTNVESLSRAAFKGGCRRFDSVIKGYGGCPMASDDLTGNMPTELLLYWLESQNIQHGIASEPFTDALKFSAQVFKSNN